MRFCRLRENCVRTDCFGGRSQHSCRFKIDLGSAGVGRVLIVKCKIDLVSPCLTALDIKIQVGTEVRDVVREDNSRVCISCLQVGRKYTQYKAKNKNCDERFFVQKTTSLSFLFLSLLAFSVFSVFSVSLSPKHQQELLRYRGLLVLAQMDITSRRTVIPCALLQRPWFCGFRAIPHEGGPGRCCRRRCDFQV